MESRQNMQIINGNEDAKKQLDTLDDLNRCKEINQQIIEDVLKITDSATLDR